MSGERHRRHRRFWGPRRWHRYLGALFAVPLLYLCGTGLLLQHQDRLGLTERKVRSSWLLKRYNQIPEGEPRGVRAGRFELVEWGGVLFLDERVLEESGSLVGAVAKPAEIVVATPGELFVYGAQGEYLDRLGEESLPAVPVTAIGQGTDGTVVIEAAGERYQLSDDLLGFDPAPESLVPAWSEPEVRDDLRGALQVSLAEGAGFTWSRVVTDLHSGRLFGGLGRWVVDLTGLAVIVLTLLGFRLLFKRT